MRGCYRLNSRGQVGGGTATVRGLTSRFSSYLHIFQGKPGHTYTSLCVDPWGTRHRDRSPTWDGTKCTTDNGRHCCQQRGQTWGQRCSTASLEAFIKSTDYGARLLCEISSCITLQNSGWFRSMRPAAGAPQSRHRMTSLMVYTNLSSFKAQCGR